MRRYPDGSYGELHPLVCAWCEEEWWGYALVEGPTRESVADFAINAVCVQCAEARGEDWDNADGSGIDGGTPA